MNIYYFMYFLYDCFFPGSGLVRDSGNSSSGSDNTALTYDLGPMFLIIASS
jgi:hypothetical protein